MAKQKSDKVRFESLDDTPVSVPVKFNRPPSLHEQIKSLIRREVSQTAVNSGMESFEEADDFEVGDDYDPQSPYEAIFDPETLDKNEAEAVSEFLKQRREQTSPPQPPPPAKADPPSGGGSSS